MAARGPARVEGSSSSARLETASRDLGYALRSLRRSPAFAIVAVLTLAVGVACVTAAFSVVDAVLLRGLPYRSPETLQTVYERSDDGALRVPSYPTFRDWQAAAASVSDAIDGLAFVRGDAVSLERSEGTDGPDQKIAAYVTPGFFRLLGTPPLLGRTFAPEEERPGGPDVAVISHELFTQRFGGDPATVGKVIAIDSVPTTIVGVMPRGFAYPNFGGAPQWVPTALWQPIALYEARHNTLSLRGLHVDSRAAMRLRQGVDSARVMAAMRTIQLRLADEYPAEQAHWTSVSLRSFSEELFGDLRSTLVLISAAIALVLVLACANVANLFLVRAGSRARELAVRSVLGAGRWRIVRQLATETLVVAGVAGVVGALMGHALVGFVRQYAAERLPFGTAIALDGRALLFALGATTLSALLVGVLPALYASRSSANLMDRLRSGATAAIGSAGERRARSVLVSLQFGLAFTLLVGAGLLIQSVRRVLATPLGYDPSNVIAFNLAPQGKKYEAPADAALLYRRIADAVAAVPGVEMAAIAGGALIPTRVEPVGQPTDGEELRALYHPVSAEYLRTMRIPLVSGRWFTEDDMRAPSGFVINESLAKRLFPGTSPLGKQITTYRASQARADFGQPITLPVIGVVGDVRQFGRESDANPELFLPYTLEVWPWMNFVARAPNALAVLRTVEAAVRGVDPAISLRGKPSVIQAGLPPVRRFVTSLLSGFAVAALLLAATGLYGIIAYGVVQRTREVGIRIALGASPRSIVRLVLRDGARYALGGAVVGLFGAFAATRLLRSMLFETNVTDPVTLAAVPLVLGIVALAASYLPARRAARTDPLVAIRAD
jgi:putative ABC transport system permease protein